MCSMKVGSFASVLEEHAASSAWVMWPSQEISCSGVPESQSVNMEKVLYRL
jgi:hypothetical protein